MKTRNREKVPYLLCFLRQMQLVSWNGRKKITSMTYASMGEPPAAESLPSQQGLVPWEEPNPELNGSCIRFILTAMLESRFSAWHSLPLLPSTQHAT